MNFSVRLIIILICSILLITSVNAIVTQYNLTDGNATVIIFNGTGTTTWTAPTDPFITNYSILIVGGGGSAGMGDNFNFGPGGGGAGGVLSGTLSGLSGTYTVVVGSGGAGQPIQNSQGFNGTNSSFGAYIAYGGGGGGGSSGSAFPNGKAGGSGGGGDQFGSAGISIQTSQAPLTGYGSAGDTTPSGGNGGGATGVITGLASSITGSSVTYATGGLDGGTLLNVNGTDGEGDGGQGSWSGTSGSGGSGIVILRYSSIEVPIALFNATSTWVDTGTNITFVDMSLQNPQTWNWSFGDGINSTARNNTHSYENPGIYTVILNVSNFYGFSNYSINITVSSSPFSNFTVNPNVGAAPLSVAFSDASTGCVTGWFWNFGDGSTSISQSPTHIYSSIGTYYPQLTVTGTFGDNVSQTVPIYVVASPIPIVQFSASPLFGSAPLNVQFTDLSAASGGITGWNWSFGDGNYSNSQNPSHIYVSTGQYSVTLVATSGVYSNYTSKIGYINIGITSGTITANFTASPTSSPSYPANIQFFDNSVCNPACTNWVWDFNNDGATDSLAQNPLYTYENPGVYTVKLIVSNNIQTGSKLRPNYVSIGPAFVLPTIPQPTGTWNSAFNGQTFHGDTSMDVPNSTFLKYWLQNFSATGNFSVYGFSTGLMAPLMHVFGFWIFLIIWGLYLFAVWIRSQDVTLPLIIGILSMGTFGLLFPKEALPVIIIMFVICGAIIITKLMKDSI